MSHREFPFQHIRTTKKLLLKKNAYQIFRIFRKDLVHIINSVIRSFRKLPEMIFNSFRREKEHHFYHITTFIVMLAYCVLPTFILFIMLLLYGAGYLSSGFSLIAAVIVYGLPLELCRRSLVESAEKDIILQQMDEKMSEYRKILKRTKRVRKHRNSSEDSESLGSDSDNASGSADLELSRIVSDRKNQNLRYAKKKRKK